MKNISKRNFIVLVIFIAITYGIYWLSRPVVIVGVHHSPRNTGYSDILVKSFPITQAGKIAWWEKNQVLLKEKYAIPRPNPNGYFNVTIWDFDDGYKEMTDADQELDLMCFDDMDTKENCIEKERLLSVKQNREGKIYYY